MILLLARHLTPCILLVCFVLQGCSSFQTDTDERGPMVIQELDSAWLERCTSRSVDLNADQRPMLIAVLSPRMAYSLLEWPRMQRVASNLGFRVEAWQDPQIPDVEWQAAWASTAMQNWHAGRPSRPPKGCLTAWSPIDHFPYVRVLLGRHVHVWPVWGVMPDQAWQAVLNNRFAALTKATVQDAP